LSMAMLVQMKQTRVDDFPGGGTTAWRGGLPVMQRRHKEQRRPWSEMATEELMMENRYFASSGSTGERIRATG
jgi:hypothetical protein